MIKPQLGLYLVCSLVILLPIAGCSPIRLVADYDENMDKGATDLQKKVETILTKIERQPSDPCSTYDAEDYEQLRESLNVLRTRAAAHDKNRETVNILYELGYQLLEDPPRPITEKEADTKKLNRIVAENSGVPVPSEKYFPLQKRHRMLDSLTSDDIRDMRALLEVHFRSLIRFETLKKRDISSKAK